MDLKAIQALMRQFDTSSLTELKLNDEQTTIYFSKQAAPTEVTPSGDEHILQRQPTKPGISNSQVIIAPIVGSVHLGATPNQVFKPVGAHVAVGDTVALIEAMKMMTEVKSSVAGTITAINVTDEETVEYGQTLFTITLD